MERSSKQECTIVLAYIKVRMEEMCLPRSNLVVYTKTKKHAQKKLTHANQFTSRIHDTCKKEISMLVISLLSSVLHSVYPIRVLAGKITNL
jgi:hypothetical protein